MYMIEALGLFSIIMIFFIEACYAVKQSSVYDGYGDLFAILLFLFLFPLIVCSIIVYLQLVLAVNCFKYVKSLPIERVENNHLEYNH